MIQFQNVYKTYGTGVNALENISFDIEEGEFVFLIGSSGSGKTTLIKMLIREENPSEGKIYFGDEDITRLSRNKIYQHRRKIGVIFQDYKLIEEKTAYENLEFVMEAAGKSHSEIKETVPYLLDIVGLADRVDAFPRELSGGEKQRVAIARALVNNPKLLIADEPTGNLDPEAAWDIVRILQKINDWGTTILMSTHGLDIVEKVAKRVLKINKGILEEDYLDGYKTSLQKSKENFETQVTGDIEEETEKVKIFQKKKPKKKKPKKNTDETPTEMKEESPKSIESVVEDKLETQEEINIENTNEEKIEAKLETEEEIIKPINVESEKILEDEKKTESKNQDKTKSETTETQNETKDEKSEIVEEPSKKGPKLKISLVDKKKQSHPLTSGKSKKEDDSDLNKLDLDKKIIQKIKDAGYKEVKEVIEAGIDKISNIKDIKKNEIDDIKIAVAKFIQNN